MPSYAFVLPFAVENNMATVMLAERNLITRRTAGKTVPGTIPEWAGQWGLMSDVIGGNETTEEAAARVLRDQASIDVTDPNVVTNFVLGNRTLVQLKTDDLTPFTVQCIFTTATALGLLAQAANNAIINKKTMSDQLGAIGVFPIDKARLKLGYCPVPPKGWQDYILQNFFGGKVPGILNTDYPTLTNQISTNSKQSPQYFTAALSATE